MRVRAGGVLGKMWGGGWDTLLVARNPQPINCSTGVTGMTLCHFPFSFNFGF